MQNTTTEKRKITTQQMALVAIMTALTCILAPFSLPIGPVPISLTNLVIYFSLYLLGWKLGTLSYVIYLLIGLVGVPVFSGFTAGPAKLFGPTGGYFPMAIIAGIVIDKYTEKWLLCLLAMIVGTIVCYALGTACLAYEAKMDMMAALWAGVIPFIPGDLVKMALAILIAPKIRAQVCRAR